MTETKEPTNRLLPFLIINQQAFRADTITSIKALPEDPEYNLKPRIVLNQNWIYYCSDNITAESHINLVLTWLRDVRDGGTADLHFSV